MLRRIPVLAYTLPQLSCLLAKGSKNRNYYSRKQGMCAIVINQDHVVSFFFGHESCLFLWAWALEFRRMTCLFCANLFFHGKLAAFQIAPWKKPCMKWCTVVSIICGRVLFLHNGSDWFKKKKNLFWLLEWRFWTILLLFLAPAPPPSIESFHGLCAVILF